MSIQHIETGAIIIGAGPAGAGTSFFLSKNGIPHVVIEKEKFPRDKVCGDAWSGKSVLTLRRANADWPDEILKQSIQLPSWGISFSAPNGKVVEIPFVDETNKDIQLPGFIATRLSFDDFLFRKIASAHNTVLEHAIVHDIGKENDHVSVQVRHDNKEYKITAPVIVGADGDKSIVRRKFLDPDTSKTSAVGLRAYYKGVSGMHASNFIELHFLKEMLPGYFWIFPLPGGQANVGVGILSEVVRKKKINLREQMLNVINNNPIIAPRFADAALQGKIQGWGLPMAGKRQERSGNNFILTGDAASLIDPFSGEGIGNALYSGMLAAEAIQQCRSHNDYSASFIKTNYDNVVDKRLGSEFKISDTLQRICNYPGLLNFIMNKLHKSPSLKQTVSSMFADIDIREQLRKSGFYLKILLNK